ncbi:hypothetical protein [Deefgea rivuli]|uniref:hypothetical protein n=1 Tax=Deefgea rivuli TaxID=400948 RepID=UPI0004879F91|nr:hypothetical protein [Deefgea rivuli]
MNTLIEQVRSTLAAAREPMDRKAIYNHCDLAETFDQISRSLNTLLNNGDIEKIAPLRNGDLCRWQMTDSAKAAHNTKQLEDAAAAESYTPEQIQQLQSALNAANKALGLRDQEIAKLNTRLTDLADENDDLQEKLDDLQGIGNNNTSTVHIAVNHADIALADHTVKVLLHISRQANGQHQASIIEQKAA